MDELSPDREAIRNVMLLHRLRFHLFTEVLLPRNTFFHANVRCMSNLLRYLMSKRNGQLFAVVGKYLRVLRSARNRDIRHTVIEQIFRAEFGIDMHQHPFGSLSLTGVA